MDIQMAVTIIVSVVVVFLFWILSQWRVSKNLPPGPPSIPLIGSLPFSGLIGSKDIPLGLTKLAKKYGNIYHLWIGKQFAVVLNDYKTIREALLDNAVAMAGRSQPRLPKYNVRQLGLSEPTYTTKFKHDRNLSLGILKEFGFGKTLMEDRITNEVQVLLNKLSQLQNQEFNPNHILKVSVANVICSIIMSKQFEHNEEQFVRLLHILKILLDSYLELVHLDYLPFLRFLPSVKRPMNTFLQTHDEMLDILLRYIKEHRKNHEEGDCSNFIHAYLDRVDVNDDETLLYIVRDLFTASTETTATFLQWALLYMANYPGIQKKVQEELDSVLPGCRAPSLADKAKLPYTEAAILEMQRLAAVLPTSVPHKTLDVVTVEGYTIPKGSVVLCNLWAVLRDPDLWPEPDQFKPERFLTKEGNVLHRPELIPFSLGRRACLGEVLARQEMFLFFTAILRNYNIRRPYGVDKIDEMGRPKATRVPQEYRILITKRNE